VAAEEAAAHDPVCHDTIHPTPDYAQAEHDGVLYFFCGLDCRDAFLDDPASVLTEERLCRARREADAAADASEDPERLMELHYSDREEEVRTLAWVLESMGIQATVYGSGVATAFGPSPFGLGSRRQGRWGIAVPRKDARRALDALNRAKLI
jgi:YHS domain-containing protein